MEWIQTLLISGLCIPSIYTHHHKPFIVETPKLWLDAQSYCRERGHDLATIDNMGAMESLLPLIEGKDDDEWWIGLHYGGPDQWHWSIADNDFYQEGEREYRNFIKNIDGSKFVVLEHGKWKTFSGIRYFICYDAGRQGEDRYVLVRLAETWIKAQTYCRGHHTDLVSIRNATENAAVWNEVGTYSAWIGLFRDGWLWSNRRRSSFRHWFEDSFENANSQACAAMSGEHSGRWKQLSCGESRPFICGPIDNRFRVFKVKVHSEDIQDLNDPVIKASISKQTQKLLNEVTSSNYHKITWTTHSDGKVFTKEQCQEEDCNI